ncbi:MAG: class I SAM-dependent methyltransferase [Alphaproteobacteria bacterium]|nr:class I SAM-dependent methyltransferase [Alphaproteobacteria bacterium]
MEIALGDPDHGYYRTRDPLGATGDFVTSPEISQVFGEIIGLWCAVAWQNIGSPKKINLVELGPGRGTLMADILRTVRNVMPSFADAIEVHMVETGAVLREQQQKTLNDYNVSWHDRFEMTPAGPLLIIANEFFDALPIDQYIKTDKGWQERRVTMDRDQDKLMFGEGGPSPAKDVYVPDDLKPSPVSSVFERSIVGEQIVGDIAKRIATGGGAALIIDYGHVRHGVGDTLQAIKSHKYHDPLTDIGEADLTTHVDFAALAKAAEAEGTLIHGPIFQGEFLTALGIEQRTAALTAKALPDQAKGIISGSRRLIASDDMGTLFKVMALMSGSDTVPAGFEAFGAESAS